ncbi:MAG: hypothetical protein IJN86_02505 [Clostridia bacterium]|nr:hypothetical protein [Clostridia bacterium]
MRFGKLLKEALYNLRTFSLFFAPFAHRFIALSHEKKSLLPCGTISTPSVREAMLRIVKCLLIVGDTLNFTLCEAQCFTAASPLLHLGEA